MNSSLLILQHCEASVSLPLMVLMGWIAVWPGSDPTDALCYLDQLPSNNLCSRTAVLDFPLANPGVVIYMHGKCPPVSGLWTLDAQLVAVLGDADLLREVGL